jgi:hypothetical protein
MSRRGLRLISQLGRPRKRPLDRRRMSLLVLPPMSLLVLPPMYPPVLPRIFPRDRQWKPRLDLRHRYR